MVQLRIPELDRSGEFINVKKTKKEKIQNQL